MANLYAQFTISEAQARDAAVDSLDVSTALQAPHQRMMVATAPAGGNVQLPFIVEESEDNYDPGEEILVTWIPVAVLGFVFTGCAIRWATSNRYRCMPLLAAPTRS